MSVMRILYFIIANQTEIVNGFEEVPRKFPCPSRVKNQISMKNFPYPIANFRYLYYNRTWYEILEKRFSYVL